MIQDISNINMYAKVQVLT